VPDEHTYTMKMSLNVLKHLGLYLYSNVPAVLSEVVANSWDADAENVWIDIVPKEDRIVITDDGDGMTQAEVNGRYLTVGYSRREDKEKGRKITLKWKREVMGRKGIGKLSLFSIAKCVELHTIRDGKKSALRMAIHDIEKAIRDDGGTYHPKALPAGVVEIEKGTRIILTGLKKRTDQAGPALRRRLARRFSIIGEEHHFTVELDGTPIKITDRDYFHKIQYLWRYGKKEDTKEYTDHCGSLGHNGHHDGIITVDGTSYQIKGWIGTVGKPSALKDPDDNLNKITIMVRGKLAEEDILEHFNEGRIYTKYLIGEINADFLDLDDQADCATSSRQSINEDDPRYVALRDFIFARLNDIRDKWDELRKKEGTEKAKEIPAVGEWFDNLKPGPKKRAKALLGTINQMTFDTEEQRRTVIKHSILAFERLSCKEDLDALERITPDNLAALAEIMGDIDDVEATLYLQIVRERVKVIDTLRTRVDDNNRERVIQEHVFDHLWLLHPSWERATDEPYMEKAVTAELDKLDTKLTKAERKGRLDIRYKLSSGKHIIVELKRPGVGPSTDDIRKQVRKYRSALRKVLRATDREGEPIEIICLLGKEPPDWKEEGGRQESEDALATVGARIVMYQKLLDDAYAAYGLFLKERAKVGRIAKLVESIETYGFTD